MFRNTFLQMEILSGLILFSMQKKKGRFLFIREACNWFSNVFCSRMITPNIQPKSILSVEKNREIEE